MYTYYMYECVYITTKRILCVHTYLQVSTIVQHGCVGPMCNLMILSGIKLHIGPVHPCCTMVLTCRYSRYVHRGL